MHDWRLPGVKQIAAVTVLWLSIAASARGEAPPVLGSDFRLGKCDESPEFSLAIHGGTAQTTYAYPARKDAMANILSEGRAALAGGAKALDIVHAAVRAMEDSGLFNAGRGATANQAGVVELDASIMDGKRQNAGAVAAVKRIKNPITAARLVMQRSPQVMLVGPHAEAFSAEHRHDLVEPSYFRLNGLDFSDIALPEDTEVAPPAPSLPAELARFSGVWGGIFYGTVNALLVVERVAQDGGQVVFGHGLAEGWGIDQSVAERYAARFESGALTFRTNVPRQGEISLRIAADNRLELIYQPKGAQRAAADFRRLDGLPKASDHGTVGAVALDRCGDLAAGTSTGGFGSKVPGRIGDSPIIGAGTYANNATAAISAAGHGEMFMRYVVAYDIAARMAYGGQDLATAVEQAINTRLAKARGRGGVIAVDAQGNVASAFSTPGLLRGLVGSRHELTVLVE